MRPRLKHYLAIPAALGVLLTACSERKSGGPPPRAHNAITVPSQSSEIAVPVTVNIAPLRAKLEREIPRQLWVIDRPGMACVPSKRVKVLFIKLKTPTVNCDIVGRVTRGPLSFVGSGQKFIVTMPIHAVVQAKDIGGVFRQETATGDARVRAVVRLSLAENWNPRGKVDIHYDWTTEPGIDFLGQRVQFTSKTDAKLESVVNQLETALEREIGRIDFRTGIAQLWDKAFTSVLLNRINPPVWMRITPQELQYGGYTLNGDQLSLRLGLKALTETFIGNRPADPQHSTLPPLAPLSATPGRLTLNVPVIADYAQLEPVILKALVKRSARPFVLPKVGALDARFAKVEAYGTAGGRVAVGVTFSLSHASKKLGTARGRVWLTGVPVNAENSRLVSFKDMAISGETDNVGTDLLILVAGSPNFTGAIAEALTQNFERDYVKLMGRIENAIADKRAGNILIRAHIDEVQTGLLKAAGQGVYLPVRGTGTASIAVAPG